MHLTK